MIRLPSRRTIIVTLTALFVISVIVVSVGWFIGAIPTYPHISEWEVCTYPEIVSSKLYGIERKELFVAICFSTSDSWEQVAAWYEPFGWTGQKTLSEIAETAL